MTANLIFILQFRNLNVQKAKERCPGIPYLLSKVPFKISVSSWCSKSHLRTSSNGFTENPFDDCFLCEKMFSGTDFHSHFSNHSCSAVGCILTVTGVSALKKHLNSHRFVSPKMLSSFLWEDWPSSLRFPSNEGSPERCATSLLISCNRISLGYDSVTNRIPSNDGSSERCALPLLISCDRTSFEHLPSKCGSPKPFSLQTPVAYEGPSMESGEGNFEESIVCRLAISRFERCNGIG